jgi:hypothetical protein
MPLVRRLGWPPETMKVLLLRRGGIIVRLCHCPYG